MNYECEYHPSIDTTVCNVFTEENEPVQTITIFNVEKTKTEDPKIKQQVVLYPQQKDEIWDKLRTIILYPYWDFKKENTISGTIFMEK